MNIYLHCEISARELDSKLLLATLAAAKGHQVVVSNLSEIIHGLKTGILAPGIFHTKSLTPSRNKIERHQKIIDKDCKITSMDEETGVRDSYDKFVHDRYSDLTIKQCSAAFGWGHEDVEALKKISPKNLDKIHITGSPRVDLWKSSFSEYWIDPKKIPKKPFLLISSNLSCFTMKNFEDNFKFVKDAGYLDRDPDMFRKMFYRISDQYKMFYLFLDAIKYISKNNTEYDIVLRPHPEEDFKVWKMFLENIPNTHVIREDAITAWIKSAFAVMHNGCTTALETTVSGKPLLTFDPFSMENSQEIFNTLGYNVKTKEQLLIKVNEIFNSKKTSNQKKIEVKISETISNKLYIDSRELAAEKILKIWDSFSDKSLSISNNWIKFYLLIKIIKLTRFCRNILGKLFPNKFKPIKENYKFPPFDENDIRGRLDRLQDLLGIEKKLECKFLSDRTLVIKETSK